MTLSSRLDPPHGQAGMIQKRMKFRLLVVVVLSLTARSLLAVPCISIGGMKLERATALTDTDTQLREYLPSGETLDHWNRMASA
uniref:hypothetical protein n=1 Tax=Cephaloticoccus sp. TaxID=1985742 RepID=UPI00404B2C09